MDAYGHRRQSRARRALLSEVGKPCETLLASGPPQHKLSRADWVPQRLVTATGPDPLPR
jgi:hypothetical protein